MRRLARLAKAIGRAHRRYTIRHEIHTTERDINLTAREIADKLEAKRILKLYLADLKSELNSL